MVFRWEDSRNSSMALPEISPVSLPLASPASARIRGERTRTRRAQTARTPVARRSRRSVPIRSAATLAMLLPAIPPRMRPTPMSPKSLRAWVVVKRRFATSQN